MGGGRGRITFVIGGARSGKSGFALQEASRLPGSKAYIATAQALDDEMRERVLNHKMQRPGEWITVEEPFDISGTLRDMQCRYEVILIDCLTMWLSNLMLNNMNALQEIDSFISLLSGIKSSLFVVSNEVGQGIVPDNRLSRDFRDMAGILNQKTAAAADEVFIVTAGIPVKIKG